jgi:hypothetical protein
LELTAVAAFALAAVTNSRVTAASEQIVAFDMSHSLGATTKEAIGMA